MTTALDLIERTKQELLGGAPEQLNKLRTTIDDSTTTIELTYDASGVAPNTYISIGLEDCYVWQVTRNTLTVERAQRSTVAAEHDAGALVYVNPRFSPALLLTELNTELNSLSSQRNGLFAVRSTELTADAQPSLSLDELTDYLEPIDLFYRSPGLVDWPRVIVWDVRRDQSDTDFATGFALYTGQTIPAGYTMRLVYKATFTELEALDDDLEDTGLPTTAYDIPPLGAAARLMGTAEARRTFLGAQPDSRRASEVPVGSSTRAAGTLLSIRQRRIDEERTRLLALYPPRRF